MKFHSFSETYLKLDLSVAKKPRDAWCSLNQVNEVWKQQRCSKYQKHKYKYKYYKKSSTIRVL